MIEDLKVTNKKDVIIDYIIVSEYSRFSRNVKLGTSEQMEDEIKNTGCNLMIVRNNLST
jgi:DNA invertase Pin-like site-specific DNA recombinase